MFLRLYLILLIRKFWSPWLLYIQLELKVPSSFWRHLRQKVNNLLLDAYNADIWACHHEFLAYSRWRKTKTLNEQLIWYSMGLHLRVTWSTPRCSFLPVDSKSSIEWLIQGYFISLILFLVSKCKEWRNKESKKAKSNKLQ